MRTDHDFNINFVQLVRQHQCLYDHTSPDYHRERVQDKAWIVIAEEIKEKVSDCKARWKNLRGRYIKHLREYTPSGSGTTCKKPYYLAEFMYFLEPFTKSGLTKSNIRETIEGKVSEETMQSTSSCTIEDLEEDLPASSLEQEKNEEEEEERSSSKINRTSTKITKYKRPRVSEYSIHDVNKSASENFSVKKETVVGKYDDADAAFLMSVLPDMGNMSEEQKRRFKIGILTMAGNILGEKSSEYK